MGILDIAMARHDAAFHAVARYSVYQKVGYPNPVREVVETGLPFEEAKARAATRQIECGAKGWGAPYFGVELENQEVARAAVTKADVWAILKTPDAATLATSSRSGCDTMEAA